MDSTQTVTSCFTHSGVISKINDSSLVVSLDNNVHCEACQIKSTCGISDTVSKKVEIQNPEDIFKMNEKVSVVLKKELGLKAVFWAYIFPFILIVTTLLIASTFLKEWLAGILCLLILVPYYLVLYTLRNSFKKAFRISVLKI